MSADLDSRAEQQMQEFFRLPLERKLQVKRTSTNSRGFADDELTKQKRDWKEIVIRQPQEFILHR